MIESVMCCWEEAITLLKNQMVEAAYEKVKQAKQNLRREEVIATRMKVDELNRSILSFNLLIIKIERQMSELQSICPELMMTTCKQFLLELKQGKGNLEATKREITRYRSS